VVRDCIVRLSPQSIQWQKLALEKPLAMNAHTLIVKEKITLLNVFPSQRTESRYWLVGE
jgi:hypothetical protein